MNIKTKICIKCLKEKSIIENFYRKSKSLRYKTICKSCTIKNSILWAKQNPDKVRKSYLSSKGRERSHKQYLKQKASLGFKEKRRKRLTTYKKRYPKKLAASKAVYRAIKKGLLLRPESCSQCNSSEDIQGHHEDYSKPLEVIWVCYPCHTRIHLDQREHSDERSSTYKEAL